MAVVMVSARRYPGHVVPVVEQTATDYLRDQMFRQVAEALCDHVVKYGMPSPHGEMEITRPS
jgi:hypothetical protein